MFHRMLVGCLAACALSILAACGGGAGTGASGGDESNGGGETVAGGAGSFCSHLYRTSPEQEISCDERACECNRDNLVDTCTAAANLADPCGAHNRCGFVDH